MSLYANECDSSDRDDSNMSEEMLEMKTEFQKILIPVLALKRKRTLIKKPKLMRLALECDLSDVFDEKGNHISRIWDNPTTQTWK